MVFLMDENGVPEHSKDSIESESVENFNCSSFVCASTFNVQNNKIKKQIKVFFIYPFYNLFIKRLVPVQGLELSRLHFQYPQNSELNFLEYPTFSFALRLTQHDW